MKTTQKQHSGPRLRLAAGHAIVAIQALQKLMAAPFPAMEAFQIAKALAVLSVNPNVVATDRTRLAMVRKHGVEKDGGVSVPPEKMPAFLAEYGAVAEKPVEFDLAPLPMAILEHAPEMTPGDMVALQPLFERNK